MDRKKATKRIGKMQRCSFVGPLVNGPYQETQEIGGLGLGGRVQTDPRGDGCVRQPGKQDSSSRRSEIHAHPGEVGRISFVALGPQIRRERRMCDSGGCHERCVVRCE